MPGMTRRIVLSVLACGLLAGLRPSEPLAATTNVNETHPEHTQTQDIEALRLEQSQLIEALHPAAEQGAWHAVDEIPRLLYPPAS